MAEMLKVLGRTVRHARKAGGASQLDVATRAGVSSAVISRFENGWRWPAELDQIMSGYANELEMDCYDLWGMAVDEARRERDSKS